MKKHAVNKVFNIFYFKNNQLIYNPLPLPILYTLKTAYILNRQTFPCQNDVSKFKQDNASCLELHL